MQKIAFHLKVASIISSVALVACNVLGTQAVSAESNQVPAAQAVTISAVCQDSESDTAMWRVANPNPDVVTLTWDTSSSPDSAALPYGNTDVQTDYDSSVTPPTVVFHQLGYADQTLQVSATSCATPDTQCVDGLVRANLDYQWSPQGIVTVSTVDGVPLCDDVTVYLSSYVLPSTYDGSGIFDDSSIPQQQFSSTSAVLQKGTAGNVMLQITVPNACTDYQLDLYYPPEVTTVSYHGHGSQLIYGNIYLHTATDCTPPAGGNGGGQVLGSTTTAANTTLADTGSNALLPMLSAVGLIIVAAMINFSVPARIKLRFAK